MIVEGYSRVQRYKVGSKDPDRGSDGRSGRGEKLGSVG